MKKMELVWAPGGYEVVVDGKTMGVAYDCMVIPTLDEFCEVTLKFMVDRVVVDSREKKRHL
jgi:hypothetical protein